MIEDKNNEQQIKDALDSLCTYLPNSIAGECKNFVDTYTDMIIEMLTSDVTPQEVINHDIISYKLSKTMHCSGWLYKIDYVK